MRAQLLTEVRADDHVPPHNVRDVITVGRLIDEWLDRSEERGRSPSTLAGYRYKIEAVIRPALGAIALEEPTARNLDTFYGAKLREGTSPASVVGYHHIISAALAQAVKWD